MARDTVGEDIAVIKTQIKNLCDSFTEYKNDNKKFVETITSRVDSVENKQVAMEQKLSLLAAFQSVFSVIIGGIATFLGSKKW